MGSGINYKRDDYMVKKLLDIINKYFKEVIIIDDSIYDNSTIYKLIDTLFFTRLPRLLVPILTDEDNDFLANFACKDIPKPRNLSEQLKYMKLCAKFNFIEKIITDNVEIGKGYDISGCKYVCYDDTCIVKNKEVTIETINNYRIILVDNILTILGGNEPRILTDKTLVSKNVYIPTLDS